MAQPKLSIECQKTYGKDQQSPLPYVPKFPQQESWQSSIYDEERRRMIGRIAKILRKSKFNDKRRINEYHQSKLVAMSRKFELFFYRSAKSIEGYKDATTLEYRVNQLYVKVRTMHYQQKNQRAQQKQRQQEIAADLLDRANQSAKHGNRTKARQYYERALYSLYRLFGKDANNDYLAQVLQVLGVVSYDLENYTEARLYSKKALDMYYRLYGEEGNSSTLEELFHLLALIEEKLGNLIDAQRYIEKTLAYKAAGNELEPIRLIIGPIDEVEEEVEVELEPLMMEI